LISIETAHILCILSILFAFPQPCPFDPLRSHMTWSTPSPRLRVSVSPRPRYRGLVAIIICLRASLLF
jgi:hypothetical protein